MIELILYLSIWSLISVGLYPLNKKLQSHINLGDCSIETDVK